MSPNGLADGFGVSGGITTVVQAADDSRADTEATASGDLFITYTRPRDE